MKKKSPPYAIIGAVVLGLVAVYVWHQIELKQAADAQAQIDKAKADAQAQIDEARRNQQPVVSTAPTNMRNVLYASQPIEAGMRISPAFYETKLTPDEILPDAYTDKSGDIVGWYATRKIEKGDPLTPRNIGKSLPYLSQRIPAGMRAITLPVFMGGDINDTGGFVVDGDRVDLLYTVATEDDKYKLNTQTVLQNVKVLFVPGPQIKTEMTDGITPVPAAGGNIAVTFEVTPEEAEALIFMTNVHNAHFSMILRGRQDQAELKVKPFNAEDYDLLNLGKVQKNVDKSEERVKELAAQIQATEQSQGTTNETTPPTPPTP
ncbi:MAG: Flp pilus assembly protein CpaB [Methylacidiphilales bacterium]|nr:Flp pilus assembly protein CpaB [Candidatus Methylacidiphilales bacterium]